MSRFQLILLISILSSLIFIITIYPNKTNILKTSQKSNSEIISLRKNFLDDLDFPNNFLSIYLNNQLNYKLKLTNSTNNHIETVNPLFYTDSKLTKEINLLQNDTDQERILKIYKFTKKHFGQSPKFYFETDNNPLSALNFYGTGDCGTAATTLARLFNLFGYKSKVWHFGTLHATTEVFYQNQWHFFDINSLGYFQDKNNHILSLDEIIKSPNPLNLNPYRQEILSTSNHISYEYPIIIKPNNVDKTFLNFFPNETKIYLNDLFIFSTDGRQLNQFKTQDIKEKNQNSMANYIRVIPLNTILDSITISDEFPRVGAIILTPKIPSSNYYIKTQPDTDKLLDNQLQYFYSTHSKHQQLYFFDLTPTLKHLESSESFSISISNLKPLLSISPSATLITFHTYSTKNIDLDPKNINSIKQHHITVQENQ